MSRPAPRPPAPGPSDPKDGGNAISVLHIVPWVSHGGVERRRLVLARGLPKYIRQSLLCLGAIEPLRSEIERAGCPVFELCPGEGRDARLTAGALARASVLARRLAPDIVHGAVFEGTTLAVACALASGARAVVEETSHPQGARSWRGVALQRIYARVAARVVTVGPAVTDYVRTEVRPPPGRLLQIVNGVDTPVRPSESLLDEERSRLSLTDAWVIGSIGRLRDDIKRFGLLIRAVEVLRRRGRPVKLLIVGDGPDARRLQEEAKLRGVSEHVVFAGYRRDVGTMLALMDVFALVSRTEALPVALAEAMLAGCPAVASSVGGAPDVVGEAGVLLAANPTAEEVAAAMERLLDDPAATAALAERGRERARRLFGERRYLDDVTAMYRAVVDEHRREGLA